MRGMYYNEMFCDYFIYFKMGSYPYFPIFYSELHKAKAFTAFTDSKEDLLAKHFIRRVLRQINLVET